MATLTRSLLFSPAVLLALFLSGGPMSFAQDGWEEYRSEHFRVLTDVDADDAGRIVADMEAFLFATEQFFRIVGIRPLSPATLILLDGSGDLRRAGIDAADFYFFIGPDRTFAILTDAGDEESFETLLYSYFHAIAARSAQNAPFWIREGLAHFYRTARWSDDGAHLEIGRAIDSYVRLVRDEGDRFDLTGLLEASAEFDSSEESNVSSAEAWALIHYLITREGGRGHDQTGELVRRMASGEGFETAAAGVFGVGVRELLADFESHLEQRRSLPRITLETDAGVQRLDYVGEVPPYDAMAALGAVQVAGGLEGAEAQLGRAIALDRNAPAPYVALAPLLIERRRYDEARYAIDQAGRREDPGPLGHYYYALSLIREHEEPDSTQLNRIRRELQATIDRDPSFTDAYHELARTYLGSTEIPDEALGWLQTALDLDPRHPDYLITYSRLLIDQERFDDAREVLSPLVDGIAEPEARDRAAEILQSIAGLTGGRGLIGEGFEEIRTGRGRTANAPQEAVPAAPAPPAAPVEIRRVVDGSQQTGRLTLVDCREGLALTLEDETGSYVFYTDSPERVSFSSRSAAGVGREIRCGRQEPPIRVVVTFRPAGADSPYAGVPTTVEFVED